MRATTEAALSKALISARRGIDYDICPSHPGARVDPLA
jgi:hypothetical protein